MAGFRDGFTAGISVRLPIFQVRRKNAIDRHRPYLDRRWNEGCHNAAQLWRETRDLGFSGTSSSVRQWILKHYGRKIRSQRQPLPPRPPRTSARQLVWHILKPNESNEGYLKELFTLSPEISASAGAAREFFRIVRTRDLTPGQSGGILLRIPPSPPSPIISAEMKQQFELPSSTTGAMVRLKETFTASS